MENTTFTSTILHLDNSKRSSFATCPRKFFYRYIKHLTSETGSTALRFGSTWHALMEGYYSSVIKNGWNFDNIQPAIELATEVWNSETGSKQFFDDYRTLENCFTSFIAYLEHFQDDLHMMEILHSERIFDIKLNLSWEEVDTFPYLSANFTELHFTGKLDLEVSLAGQHWINEFKTTGQPIQSQASRLQRSAQILGYTYAANKLGADIAGTLISIHQLSGRKVKDGGYGKLTREFVRQPNVFSNADLASWRESFLYTANQIAFCNSISSFPCQFDSCYQFGQCTYTKLCEQNRPFNQLNLQGFVTEEWDVLKSGASSPEAGVLTLED